ncbi:MAG: hypothetical protein V1755_02715 [Chloroflexota bacterium]
MAQVDRIEFVAAVAKIQTLADGGIRATFDLPEDAIEAASWLMTAKRIEEAVKVTCEAVLER